MLSKRQKTPRNKQYWRKVSSDFILVLLIFCVAYMTSSHFNLSDNYFLWARAYENTLDIDELPISLLASLAALLWISERRIYESNTLMKQNHALLQRVLEVQEIERKRISQDIHDDLGQYLNAIITQATGLTLDRANPRDVLNTAERIIQTADHAYQSARQMMHSLRPVALDELGLTAAIEHLVDTWQQAQQASGRQTQYHVNINNDIDQFDDQTNIGIFRVVQEALTNIAKHADASEVIVSIETIKNSIFVTIKDNGTGFNTKEKKTGYGLIGMVERIEALGGTLSIGSNHLGTELVANIANEPKTA